VMKRFTKENARKSVHGEVIEIVAVIVFVHVMKRFTKENARKSALQEAQEMVPDFVNVLAERNLITTSAVPSVNIIKFTTGTLPNA